MRNKIQSGQYLAYTNSTDAPIESGDIVVFDPSGTPFVGVATKHIPAGGTGLADLDGVYKFPKTAVECTLGKAMFMDGSGTVSSTGDIYVGRAVAPALASSATCLVRINFGSAPAATAG